jgi:hypothetical protein
MDLTIPEQDLALKRQTNDFAETQLVKTHRTLTPAKHD